MGKCISFLDLKMKDFFRCLQLKDYFIKEVRTDLHVNMNGIVKMTVDV